MCDSARARSKPFDDLHSAVVFAALRGVGENGVVVER